MQPSSETEKKACKQKLTGTLNDALYKHPHTVRKMLRELKDPENAEGENKCKVSATKWINHQENLISADVNVSRERKRQVETELANAVKDTKSAHPDRPITSAEVVHACRTLKNRKAPGKDGITKEIRASLPDMCSVLNKLFNVILSTGRNPDSWKTGVDVPIYKSGDSTNPSNYRGITLNSSLWHTAMHSLQLQRLLWIYCPGHAGVSGNERADRLASTADITSGLQLGRAEVLRGLRNFLSTDKPEHHSIDRLKERGVEKGSGRHSTLKGRERSVFNQANIGTVSRATLGKLLRDEAERIWAFPSATMPS